MIRPRDTTPLAHCIRTATFEGQNEKLNPDPYGLLHQRVVRTGESQEVLNGRVGEAKQYDPTRGQFWVEFDDDVVGLTLVKPENLALHKSPSPLAEGAGQQLHQNSRQQWDREASHRGELEQWEHQFEEPDIGPHATPHAR